MNADESLRTRVPAGLHAYRGTNLTRPDWPSRHDDDPRAHNLVDYLNEPHRFSEQVLGDSGDTVLIVDKYPKAQVHLLLLPRWQPHRDYHPHDALSDPELLQVVRRDAQEGLKIAQTMLRDRMEVFLAKHNPKVDTTSLLSHRDFSKDFRIGIHAHPSQHHLHIHIISRDMVSDYRYSARHYRSFNTPFFCDLTAYPLEPADRRRSITYQNGNLMTDEFICWRCNKNYGTDYPALRKHIEQTEWPKWVVEG